MLISVVIPVYNVAPYLRRCVDSVINQTYTELEIILVDDGSTDESPQICDEYAQKYPLLLGRDGVGCRVIHKSNGGLSDARNAGLKVAIGEYVVFLDSDDCWLCPNGIEQMVHRLEIRKSDILLFKRVDIYPNHKSYQTDYDEDYIRSHSAQEVFKNLMLSERFNMSAWDKLIRRNLLVDNKLLFVYGLISEDVDFSCHLWQIAQTVDVLNLSMYGYFHRENSISTSYSIKSLQSYDWMFTFWKEQIAQQCINHHAIGAFMANLYVSCSYNYYSIARKDRKQAKQILLRHQDLLNYAASKKSLRMKKVVNVVGMYFGIFVFATYGWLKRTIYKP